MTRHVVYPAAFQGSVWKIISFLQQYPAGARITMLTEDWDNPQHEPHFVVEFDETARTLRDEEIDRSWRNNPDRMGGSFSDQEVRDYIDSKC